MHSNKPIAADTPPDTPSLSIKKSTRYRKRGSHRDESGETFVSIEFFTESPNADSPFWILGGNGGEVGTRRAY